MSLPEGLRRSVADWLERHAGSRRQGSAALSATYRAGGNSGEIDLGAYLVARLPATFAAIARVLSEVATLRPDLSPASLIDAGSGPGTASWAALEAWDRIEAITFLDSSAAFLALAGDLARTGAEALVAASPVLGRIEQLPDGLSADLVVAAYALAELPLEQAAAAAAGLFRASRQALVLVEPGTPRGFARLAAARRALIEAGAVPVAPCTHALSCPVAAGDWCHFSVRLARSRAHMHAKAGHVPFEDERFAYLAMARDGRPSGGSRIVGAPHHAKPGVTFISCADGRLSSHHVARRDAVDYRKVRKLAWGDLLSPDTREDTP